MRTERLAGSQRQSITRRYSTRCFRYSVYAVPGVCCTRCMLYSVYVVLATVLGYPASVRVGPEPKAPVEVRNCQATRPADSLWAKPGPVPVNLRVLPGLARPVGSNLQFWFSGFTFMVAFRYATDNRKIMILVHHGVFSMHWPP